MFGCWKALTILLPVVSTCKEAAENLLCNYQAAVNQFEKKNWEDVTWNNIIQYIITLQDMGVEY